MNKKSQSGKIQNSKKVNSSSVTPSPNVPKPLPNNKLSQTNQNVAGYVQIRISKAVANQYMTWKETKFGKRQINLIKLNDQIIKEYIKNNPLE